MKQKTNTENWQKHLLITGTQKQSKQRKAYKDARKLHKESRENSRMTEILRTKQQKPRRRREDTKRNGLCETQ